MTKKYTSPSFSLAPAHHSVGTTGRHIEDFELAYLEISGLDVTGPSFIGRVFFNNPEADENTPLTPEDGYAGSFSVFGHGGCSGDPGHCAATPGVREFDKRPQKTAKNSSIQCRITAALKKALASGEDLKFTIVPVDVAGSPEKCDLEDPLKFQQFQITARYKTNEGQTIKHQIVAPKASEL